MTIRRQLTHADREKFPIGQAIRYRPGQGTYGYEDCVEADGMLPGIVRGHSMTRIRVELRLVKRWNTTATATVNADQLERA